MPPDSSRWSDSLPSSSAELEAAVDRLAELAQSSVTRGDFYGELLTTTARLLSPLGAAVWLRTSRDALRRAFELSTTTNVWGETDRPWHRQLLTQALAEPAPFAALAENAADNPSNTGVHTLVFAALGEAAESAGVFEVVLPADRNEHDEEQGVRLVGLLAELAGDFERHRQRRELIERESLWERLEQFVRRVHVHRDVDRIAYEIANEGRLLVGCDRLSVFTRDGETCQLRAASGLEALDPRATAVQTAEQLIQAVLASGATSWWTPDDEELPPQLAQALESHTEQSHAVRLAIVPLQTSARGASAIDHDGDRASGALLIEQFADGVIDDLCRLRAEAIAEHSAIALEHSLAQERMPLAKLSRWLDQRRLYDKRAKNKWTIAAVVAAAIVVALCVIPAEFVVEARGTLEPAEQREVFASADAIVDRISVEHGDRVAKGATLVELRRPQLDFEFSRVAGELQTARKRLASLQARRLAANPVGVSEQDRYHEMTGDEEELKELLRSLEQQDQLLRMQQQELTLRSPVDGQILTWDVETLLAARPVQRGQVLLSVARTEGPWVLKLAVPDDQAGYLPSSKRDEGERPSVSFVLTAHPQQVHVGHVREVAMATDLDDEDRPIVTVTVDVDRDALSPLRPRATVLGKIHCGRKPLGYVWFHSLWRAVRTALFF